MSPVLADGGGDFPLADGSGDGGVDSEVKPTMFLEKAEVMKTLCQALSGQFGLKPLRLESFHLLVRSSAGSVITEWAVL